MDHSRCIMCKSVCSPAPQPLRDSQWDDKSELRLDDARIMLGQVFLSLPMRWKWDKARVCMDHSRCIMCKSVCSPSLQPLRDSQWDDKSELRLDDARTMLGQVFLSLPMRWKWDKARVCVDHSRCIMCKSVCSPSLQPLRESQWDDKSELRLDDARTMLGQVFLCLTNAVEMR